MATVQLQINDGGRASSTLGGTPVRRIGCVVGVVALAAALVVATPPVVATGAIEPESAERQILVGYSPGASGSARAEARRSVGGRLLETVVSGASGRAHVELVGLRDNDKSRAINRLERNPKVAYAEPNWLVTHGAESEDPYYTSGSLWGMYGDGTSPANQYGSQAGEAWAAGNTGATAVYVGVIDEGIDTKHPDLDANIWTNPFDPEDGSDNDGNGVVDDVHGWDFFNDDSSVYDGDDDHGTHVAGTIGAESNGAGVVGVNWSVTLISGKFLGPNGGYISDAVRAVDYFTDLKARHGLNIVATNNSWGGGGYSQAMYDAIETANLAGILFIAAAGNGGRDGKGDNNDSSPSYPSSYENANVIAVAAINSNGGKPSWSNYGATTVDLGAPGMSIYSTVGGGGYSAYSGTSMATPHVTGAAAIYAALDPTASAAKTKQAILDSTIPTSSMEGRTVTGGRLSVSALLGVAAGPFEPAPPEDGTGLTLSARGYKVKGFQTVDLTWSNATSADVDIYRSGVIVTTTVNDGTHTDKLNQKGGGTHTYKVCEADAEATTCSNEVTVTF